MADQIIRLYNPTDEEWRGKFDSQVYVVPPGGESMAPYPALVCWFGNPATHNADKRNPERRKEFERLRAKYGVHEHLELWEKQRPHIECYTIDGQRIPTVVDDPEGVTVSAATMAQDENQMLSARIAALENEIMALRTAQGTQERKDTAELVGAGVGADTPGKASLAANLPPLHREGQTAPEPGALDVPTPDPSAPASEVDTPQAVKVGRRSKMGEGESDEEG